MCAYIIQFLAETRCWVQKEAIPTAVQFKWSRRKVTSRWTVGWGLLEADSNTQGEAGSINAEEEPAADEARPSEAELLAELGWPWPSGPKWGMVAVGTSVEAASMENKEYQAVWRVFTMAERKETEMELRAGRWRLDPLRLPPGRLRLAILLAGDAKQAQRMQQKRRECRDAVLAACELAGAGGGAYDIVPLIDDVVKHWDAKQGEGADGHEAHKSKNWRPTYESTNEEEAVEERRFAEWQAPRHWYKGYEEEPQAAEVSDIAWPYPPKKEGEEKWPKVYAEVEAMSKCYPEFMELYRVQTREQRDEVQKGLAIGVCKLDCGKLSHGRARLARKLHDSNAWRERLQIAKRTSNCGWGLYGAILEAFDDADVDSDNFEMTPFFYQVKDAWLAEEAAGLKSLAEAARVGAAAEPLAPAPLQLDGAPQDVNATPDASQAAASADAAAPLQADAVAQDGNPAPDPGLVAAGAEQAAGDPAGGALPQPQHAGVMDAISPSPAATVDVRDLSAAAKAILEASSGPRMKPLVVRQLIICWADEPSPAGSASPGAHSMPSPEGMAEPDKAPAVAPGAPDERQPTVRVMATDANLLGSTADAPGSGSRASLGGSFSHSPQGGESRVGEAAGGLRDPAGLLPGAGCQALHALPPLHGHTVLLGGAAGGLDGAAKPTGGFDDLAAPAGEPELDGLGEAVGGQGDAAQAPAAVEVDFEWAWEQTGVVAGGIALAAGVGREFVWSPAKPALRRPL
ncbi:hypothetical protein WJX81_003180 [Elliptochloris bilobata]|uniref:Uncharacterized protein n=1 Tax=Elliptochloris bilobata TaxID=381761 RepID=A0AAW1S4M8_9CHLO